MSWRIQRLPRELRRALSLGAMRSALVFSRPLPPRFAIYLGASLGRAGYHLLPLRARLRQNLSLGLGADSVPDDAERKYFRNLGRWFGWSMSVYHCGFWRSSVPEVMAFGPSVAHLDEALARGRGAVLASPHQFCHELGAAYISGRHKVVALVRASQGLRESLKTRWYEATGMEVLYRPRRSTLMTDTFSLLRVLKSGGLLAVTPDVIVPRGSGVPVTMFRRQVTLSPGLVFLAMKARAPLLTCYSEWTEDGRFLLHFTEAIQYPAAGDRKMTAMEGLQAWCHECEEYFRKNPENWMFWLDKRWTRALRATEKPPP